MTPRIKVVGLGLHLEIWGRQLHSGDIIRIPEEDYWCTSRLCGPIASTT